MRSFQTLGLEDESLVTRRCFEHASASNCWRACAHIWSSSVGTKECFREMTFRKTSLVPNDKSSHIGIAEALDPPLTSTKRAFSYVPEHLLHRGAYFVRLDLNVRHGV
jgi:hypothetical protein